MDDLRSLFTTLAFPAAVAAFVLIRLEARLRDIQIAVTALTIAIEKHNALSQRTS